MPKIPNSEIVENIMKEKFCIEIAGIQMTILSDEGEEFVNTTVSQLDRRIRDLTVQNKRCSKLDATLLCALDFLGEKIKNEKKIKNLEAQISLYEATIKRLRDEAEAAQAAPAPAPEAAPVKAAPAKTDAVREPAAGAEAKPVKKAEAKAAEKAEAKKEVRPETKPEIKEPAKAAPQAKAETKTGAQLSLGDGGNEKIRQIENLLRQRGEGSDKPAGDGADTKNDKLRQIEDLLRKSGSASLSDALKKADS